jgi:hypothetical protein
MLALGATLLARGATAAPGDFEWNRGWDATGLADMDENGATVCAGMWFGAINFGGGNQVAGNAITGDVFVARYSPTGGYLWARTFTPANPGVEVTAVTAAPNGAVYVAGRILGASSIDFGGGALAGANEMWIVKFDDLGNYLWSDTFGPGIIRSLDGDQNLLAVGGEFGVGGAIDFGGGAITSNGGADAFVALLHGGAAHVWSAGFGDANEQITKDVDVDASGTVVATGSMQGMVDFGGGVLTANASPDVWVAKFDPTGVHQWSKNHPGPFGPGVDMQVSIAQDASSRVVLAGTVFNNPVDFGGGVLAPLGGTDAYVATYDAAGIHLWSDRYGSPLDDEAHDVAFDAGDNLVVTGTFENMIDFGGGALVSAGLTDLFVAGFDYFGGFLWNRRYGTMNADDLCRVVTDPLGDALLFGSADNGVNFGGGALPDAGFYLAEVRALTGAVGAPVIGTSGTAAATFVPNPFRATSEIRFDVPRAQVVDVALHDVAGRRVRSLATRAFPAGEAALGWDGRDDAGRELPSGVYFWRIEGPAVSASGRVTRLR